MLWLIKIKVLNEEGLRNKKEFVNHKILDLAGDFFCQVTELLEKLIVTKADMN